MSATEEAFVLEVYNLTDQIGSLNRSDVQDHVLSTLAKVGVSYFAAAQLPQPRVRFAPYHLATVWPPNWLHHYDRSGFLRYDPIVSRCFTDLHPFAWSDVKVESGTPEARLMSEATEHGMATGITVPIHDAFGFTGGVSMSGERLDLSPKMTKAVHLLAIYFYQAAESLLNRERSRTRRLAPRERDVLAWAAQGLSAGEIADKLGLSETTVVGYSKSARTKLGARTTTQAVVTAMRHRDLCL